jgi:hypothetical protein
MIDHLIFGLLADGDLLVEALPSPIRGLGRVL